MNQDDFVKAFHNRVYAFSSGTQFSVVSSELQEWVKKYSRKGLTNLRDDNGLYSILGDTMIKFMKKKPTPYLKNALLSKVRV